MSKNTNSVKGGAMPIDRTPKIISDRRHFIGGSDAQIIMGKDEKALLRLWREKRGEEAPIDLSGVLVVQLGLATEDLNRRCMNSTQATASPTSNAMRSTGLFRGWRPRWMGWFMLPWSFSEEAAAEKHMAQLQHDMLVAGTKKSVLSIINGGGKWMSFTIEADPIYQTILIAAEKSFWRSVKTGEPPALFDCEPPKPRIEAVRVVDIVTH
jgi:predicted phage-related endonuclease